MHIFNLIKTYLPNRPSVLLFVFLSVCVCVYVRVACWYCVYTSKL